MTQDGFPAGSRRVAVVGQGYVGLPLALRACEVGHDVVGFDLNETKVADLGAGRTESPELQAALARALASGRYRPSSSLDDLADFDVAVVAVPTPLSEGRPDLSAVIAAARAVGRHARGGSLVVLESTVAPGTTRAVFATQLRAAADAAGRRYPAWVAFSPERIDPGNPTWRLENTPKLVGGVDEPSTAAAAEFYRELCDTVVEVSSPEVAEMAKLLENTYRHVNIALVNEFAMHAHSIGVDVWQVIEAAGTKPFGFHAFRPGPGVGGHCLPIDPAYLSDAIAARTGRRFETVELALRINTAQPHYVVDRAIIALNDRRKAVSGSRILILGLSYKPGSADMREAPSGPIIARLAELGADISVADPHVDPADVRAVGAAAVPLDELPSACQDADLVICITDHPEFPYADIAASGAHVLDTRAAFPPGPHIVRL